jgi:V/A-type H+-transporting ATPase subunit C
MALLSEKGWGDMETGLDSELVLSKETEKTWAVVRSLAKDASIFEVLSYTNLYHNLKAAIKHVVIGKVDANIFYDGCAIDKDRMIQIISEKEFSALPGNMGAAAQEAYETFLHTRDGQLCDIIIDRAALDAIYEAGSKAKDDILRKYAETTVAVADIKIAVRSQKTGKSLEFMQQAMAPCSSLNVDRLAREALGGLENICSYLSGTDYAAGAEALAESPSAFERWCDNRMIEMIQPQKYNAFSAGPLVAYVLARENEIKTVRIILSGKLNHLPDEWIRERVREMYV